MQMHGGGSLTIRMVILNLFKQSELSELFNFYQKTFLSLKIRISLAITSRTISSKIAQNLDNTIHYRRQCIGVCDNAIFRGRALALVQWRAAGLGR